ncbi:TniQ family protein [Paraburkholderia agricolaris]|uniref:TniQ family protein n=1 Tax=Paraburkholderia agricolaris TaxID=2152888 RepID=UPI0038BB697D
MRLVSTVPPFDDESGFGYYRRLAANNALWGWRELAGLADVTRSRSALLGHPDHIAAGLGLDDKWSRFASRQEKQCRSWRGLHRSQSDAVCPACLADEVYLRHYWEHAYVTACPVHRTLLVDRCEGCRDHLSTNRERIEQCACGHDLRNLVAVASVPSQHWLSTLIASDGRLSSSVFPKLRHVKVDALCALVRILCLHADPSTPPPRRSAASPKSVSHAVEFLAPLEHLLVDWPTGFEKHVAERIAAGNAQARTLNTLLGQWYVSAKKICQGDALEPFLKVVIEVAAEKFDGVLGLDVAKEIAADVTEYVRLPDAAKGIGVSRDRLLKAANAGECMYRTRRLGTRGLVYEIPEAEIERINQRRSEWVSDTQACEIAKVPQSVLNHMVHAEVIAADANWRHDIHKGGPIQLQSLQSLFENVNRFAKDDVQDDDERVTLAGLTSRRMGDKRAIQTVMKAIAAGRMVAVARGRHLGQMGFLRSDVSGYFGTPLLESGMSVQQLAKSTGWKWESIAHWINVGLLESQEIMLRGQPCRVVSPQHLLAFRQTYVPLADLAKAMGTRSSSLSTTLTGVDIVGALLLPNGSRRGGLVRMADIGRLAVVGSRARRSFVSADSGNESLT